MTEIELKFEIRKEDIKRLSSLLQKMGYLVAVRRVLEKTVMYDNPEGLMQTTNGRIRLRISGKRCELSYKKPITRDGIKKEIEYEVEVSDFAQAENILNMLGFLPTTNYERFRTTLKKEGVKVTFDEYPFACFLEIEGKETKIKELAISFDFNLKGNLTEPCDTLFQRWRKERGLPFKPHMLFKDYNK